MTGYIVGRPLAAIMAPGTMIFLAVLGFNLLGDGLREAVDPDLRQIERRTAF